jgi:hypothetical protein
MKGCRSCAAHTKCQLNSALIALQSDERRGERWRRTAGARIANQAPPAAIRSTEKLDLSVKLAMSADSIENSGVAVAEMPMYRAA